jgi:hypothetical protein
MISRGKRVLTPSHIESQSQTEAFFDLRSKGYARKER